VVLASQDGWGLFADEGVETVMMPLPGRRDRMLAFEAGQIDVLVTDLVQALILVSRDDSDAVIVGASYSPEDTAEDAPLPAALVAHSDYAISGLEQLVEKAAAGHVRIAVPAASDLEYLIDTLLQANGLTPPTSAYAGEDDLLLNMIYVGLGQLGAGVFPQPYGELIMHYGHLILPEDEVFEVLADFSELTVPQTVIVFRRSLLEADRQKVAAFFRALDTAVERLNALPVDEQLDLGWKLTAELFLPGQKPEEMPPGFRQQVEVALEALFIPEFSRPKPVDPDSFAQVRAWAKGKGYIERAMDYSDVVVPPVRENAE